MITLVLRLGLNAVAIWVAVRYVDGLAYDVEDGWLPFVVLALLLAGVNGLVKPVATFLSLPAIVLTLGLFLVVVNILMFAIVIWLSETLGVGITAPGGFQAVALGGIVVSLVVWVGELVLGD